MHGRRDEQQGPYDGRRRTHVDENGLDQFDVRKQGDLLYLNLCFKN
jgi:hypothetical protein